MQAPDDLRNKYDRRVSPSLPSSALKNIWNENWSSYEIAATKEMIAELRSLEEKIGLGQGHVIDEIQKRFQHEISKSREQIR